MVARTALPEKSWGFLCDMRFTMFSSLRSKGWRWSWRKLLFHPLTGIAVGAHLLLLTVPYDPAPPEPVVEEDMPEEDESIPVDILNLSAVATDTPPPPEAPAPQPQTAPPPPSAAPQPAPAPTAALPQDVPVEGLPPNTDPAVPAGETNPPAGGDTGEPPNQPPAYDPGQDQGVFIDGFSQLGLTEYGSDGLPDPRFFRKDNANFFLSNGQPVAGALNARWVDKEPEDVLASVQTAYGDSVQIMRVDEYGQERLYELSNSNGDVFMYVSFVQMVGSSLLVMWPANPNQSAG